MASLKPSNGVLKPPNDETTPLLATNGTSPVAQTNEEVVLENATQEAPNDEDDRPLPRMQIFLLCYARLVEPVAFFGIFPFINKMIWETGELERDTSVGFVSGLIVCVWSE
jgi:hypothetical protein